MKNRKHLLFISIIIIGILASVFINGNKTISKTYSIIRDKQFDSAYANTSKEDFIAEGFNYGDSVDVSFSNGYKLEDIPIYTGYYVKTGEPLVVCYPTYEYVAVTLSSNGIWTQANLSETDTVTITLREKEKYLNIQNKLNLTYTNSREDYESDEVYTNAREINVGNIKDNMFYRGSSPYDNSIARAFYVNKYLENININFILDLSDKEEKMNDYFASADFKSEYAKKLFMEEKVVNLGLTAAYMSENYKKSLINGFRSMLENNGPVYIHCTEGKDRTGFVCFLIESLAGASYEEMVDDYMMTYNNYYGVDKNKDKERYDLIVDIYFDTFVRYLLETKDKNEFLTGDYKSKAIQYLQQAGMSQAEINELITYINK